MRQCVAKNRTGGRHERSIEGDVTPESHTESDESHRVNRADTNTVARPWGVADSRRIPVCSPGVLGSLTGTTDRIDGQSVESDTVADTADDADVRPADTAPAPVRRDPRVGRVVVPGGRAVAPRRPPLPRRRAVADAPLTAPSTAPTGADFELVFDLDQLVDEADPLPANRPGERMHSAFESIYGRVGPGLARNGWPSFPQERTDRRQPAVHNRVRIKWGELRGVPDVRRIADMAICCAGENGAIPLGHEGTFAIDADVSDLGLSNAIRACARRVLGGVDCDWTRFGRFPRFIMLFRTAPGVDVRSKAFVFAQADDVTRASGDKVEVIGHSGCFTAYGVHHKTGDYFKWEGAQPFTRGPQDVPLVTEDQIKWFLREVQLIRSFVHVNRR